MATNFLTALTAKTLTQQGVVAKPTTTLQQVEVPALVSFGQTPQQVNTTLLGQNITGAASNHGSQNPLDQIGSSIANVGSDIVSGAQAVASAAKSVANTPIVKGALNDIGDALGSPGLGDTVAADANEAADITGQVNSQVNQVAQAVKNSPLGQVPGVDSLANGLIAGTGSSNQAVGIDSAIAAGQLHNTTQGVSSNIGFDYQTYDHPPVPQAAPPPKIVFADRAAWQTYARGNVGGLRG